MGFLHMICKGLVCVRLVMAVSTGTLEMLDVCIAAAMVAFAANFGDGNTPRESMLDTAACLCAAAIMSMYAEGEWDQRMFEFWTVAIFGGYAINANFRNEQHTTLFQFLVRLGVRTVFLRVSVLVCTPVFAMVDMLSPRVGTPLLLL